MAPDPTPEEETRMMARYRQQLTELLTNYGKIDMLCLDMWLGKKVWPQTRDTILSLRKLQPDVMLRARGIGNYGDYYTPERFTPGGKENTEMPWFEIFPLASSFSYEADPAKYKGGEWIVKMLADIVAKGGNFMVGIGPDGNGQFHPRALADLHEPASGSRSTGKPSMPRARVTVICGRKATRSGSPAARIKNGLRLEHGLAGRRPAFAFGASPGWLDDHLARVRSSHPVGRRCGAGLDAPSPRGMKDEAKRPCRFVYCFKIEVR